MEHYNQKIKGPKSEWNQHMRENAIPERSFLKDRGELEKSREDASLGDKRKSLWHQLFSRGWDLLFDHRARQREGPGTDEKRKRRIVALRD